MNELLMSFVKKKLKINIIQYFGFIKTPKISGTTLILCYTTYMETLENFTLR